MTFSVVTTGGTLDKEYGSGIGVRDLHIGSPVTPSVLEYGLHIPFVEHIEICRKDSLDLDEDDILKICRAVKNSQSTRVLISHGTDTLIRTAAAIKDFFDSDGCQHKRVVLFGASYPACLNTSDAEVRIGFATGVLLASKEPGVIIAMDGIHVDFAACEKGEDGIFHS